MTQFKPQLRKLERHLQWMAIPNIAILIVTLQALGSLLVMSNPAWRYQLALDPQRVMMGEYYRLVTYLALPLSTHPLWMIFVLWFLYFVLNTIENQWGAFKTTLYVLISMLATIAYCLTTGYVVDQVGHFESTLFLAAACLFPNMEILLFFVVPVKLKWLAMVTGGLVLWEFFGSGWHGRGYLLVIYANFLVFFAPALLERLRLAVRRANYRRKL